MLGVIKSIEEVHDLQVTSIAPGSGTGGRLGVKQMLNQLFFSDSFMDGYKVDTDNHTLYVLIDNGQCCSESWGYLSSEDDLNKYIGSTLTEVNLTDIALNQKRVDYSGYYKEAGGIQFVDFHTDSGVFQLAVYNGHNGYYGHGILIVKDDDVILSDTL
ncbi:hypothetical protein RE628_11440 [Paenibacillus sp. D2_2]|uniref:DUF7448 domain-containing protein n=1 Tax=Paenibacillus sp. D2_2 TaxID=3073092 RepID=UPI002814BE5E|nr:hypothetical protein [Paenibacillus sp. D2_2]WMT42840.1 hypothetical protein RE628_11440 [Paenibacillus sp. D2_2]